MRLSSAYMIPAIAGVAAASLAFFAQAGAQGADVDPAAEFRTAVFAGGCFWCVEADFDKVEGVVSTVSGFSGGDLENPSYKQVTFSETGHYEAVEVTYDPADVSYDELVAYFFRHIDPTDADGQFCDKGSSYRTAIFVQDLEERAAATEEIGEIARSGRLGAPIVTNVLDFQAFYPAEDYHQDYYIKNPLKYQYYRRACGRDARLKELWRDGDS